MDANDALQIVVMNQDPDSGNRDQIKLSVSLQTSHKRVTTHNDLFEENIKLNFYQVQVLEFLGFISFHSQNQSCM